MHPLTCPWFVTHNVFDIFIVKFVALPVPKSKYLSNTDADGMWLKRFKLFSIKWADRLFRFQYFSKIWPCALYIGVPDSLIVPITLRYKGSCDIYKYMRQNNLFSHSKNLMSQKKYNGPLVVTIWFTWLRTKQTSSAV